MDDETKLTLEEELAEDLTAELEKTDELFDKDLLLSKIKNAIREVKRARRYPSYYADEMVETDVYDFYSNIRAIALYDYNMIGNEGQTSSTENGTSRVYADRSKLFCGIIPLSKF